MGSAAPAAAGWQPKPSSGAATAALILGICGLVLCPLIPSILAVVYGSKARNEIDASGGQIDGRGLATAGLVLGWIGVVIYGLFGLLILAVAVLSARRGDRGPLRERQAQPVAASAPISPIERRVVRVSASTGERRTISTTIPVRISTAANTTQTAL